MSKEEKKVSKEKIILGIDPGTNVMGYGLILIEGKKYSLIQYGVIHLKKYATHELKLKKIFERIIGIIDEYHPDSVALEAPFYGENIQSMLKLGRAQGVAMAAALSRDIPITEYSPKKIKQSVTGNGNASKEQVAEMLKTLLNIKEIPKLLDATDALAVAVCHHFHDGRIQTSGKSAGWKSFLQENPDRVKGL
ncbi:crossover junction endodeoxyribonuclease RuvC [Rhodonellum psychrophilum GCM71 = DSM 17998]|uniref:Crossover junction endodeoxyribonuclease RuvC n=2 Tax=Rhodonellum TaxID=336827 RepID=U5BV32_9BACT|nr:MULTISPECIES: crossover junction endodeoxyribonuclease RuvC [Rhodonellum]ERM81733.1 crossover junction endodeoxyribonuclease RuvC [Rhodonellum psychrophilum GCM71 = DSM 17998]MDO9551896.1 crossover junction endodeoxyribonuclease RuvC [Rhodonellum sp.]SDZ55835.1 Holliday junction endonuclease RuvC [Rhodonellum ikkaensis]